uniref:Uncharacterized protein n=1 Tax=Rhizophora mucronata TaxID=61149 RepID=A0A2P2NIG0_RHIMU
MWEPCALGHLYIHIRI